MSETLNVICARCGDTNKTCNSSMMNYSVKPLFEISVVNEKFVLKYMCPSCKEKYIVPHSCVKDSC